jgi:hypothetical protein
LNTLDDLIREDHASLQQTFDKPIVILQLIRFNPEYIRGNPVPRIKKLSKQIAYPDHLVIEPGVTEYRLASVVFHRGKRHDQGHYLAVTTDLATGRRTLFDDEYVVENVRINDKGLGDAYLLFYERIQPLMEKRETSVKTAEMLDSDDESEEQDSEDEDEREEEPNQEDADTSATVPLLSQTEGTSSATSG